ncbi:MAG: FixH family protein [Vicinamibacterales bacterium]
MERFVMTLVFAATAAAWPAGCGGQSSQRPAPGTTQTVDITFKSEPEPPKMGENTFEVMVMGAGAQPITDADVSVAFYMAAMPSMNMPEMRNNVPLKHEGNGRYRGTGNVTMAGTWEATVTVMRGGQEVGSKKVTVTAK